MAADAMGEQPWRASQGVPEINKIGIADLTAALREGWDDFKATAYIGLPLAAIFVVGGWVLIWATLQDSYRGLSFPLVAGFALVGPFAAVGYYEISRRRELGLPTNWRAIGGVVKAATRRQIVTLGFVLMFALAVWSRVAVIIYAIFFGLKSVDFLALIEAVFTTSDGMMFFVVGNLAGAFFATVVFSFSVISFPFLLDRDADVITAIVASVKSVLENPRPMLLWAGLIGCVMVVASIPAFLGLFIALPILGHASWRLYRRVAA